MNCPDPPSSAPDPAAWVWLTIVVLVMVYELWAVWTKKPKTLSEWLRRHFWARLLGVSALIAFIVHIFL